MTEPQSDVIHAADEAGEVELNDGDSAETDGATDGAETERADDADGDDGEDTGAPNEAALVREGDIAGDYLERLLDILDVDGDIDLDVEGERAVVAMVGGDLKHLIGTNGATLEALQELTRLTVRQQTGNRSRLMLDVDGYRSRRRDELTELARTTAQEVLDSGEARKLGVMSPFERKVVHDTIADFDGVWSESEGEEPSRRVVVRPEG